MHSALEASTRPSFWRRRIVAPIIALLTQGVTAEKVARTLGVGTVCSLFPFFGTTSALNLVVGLWLRMNQPILQTINQLLGPLQVVLILVYVRLGEQVWRAGEDRFTVAEMLRVFRDETFVAFLDRFGRAGWHAFTGWLLTAPLLFALVYFSLRPVLRRVAGRTGRRPSGSPADAPV